MTMTASPISPVVMRYRPPVYEMHVDPNYNWLDDASDDEITARLHYNETHI